MTVGARTLRKRLKEKGFPRSVDERRQTHTVRRTVEGVKDRSVLHLRLSSLFSDGDETDEPDDEGEEPDENGDSGPIPSSDSAVDPQKPDEKTDEASGIDVARRASEQAPDAEEPLGNAESDGERRVRRVVEGGEARPEDGGVADEPFGLENLGTYTLVATTEGLNELIAHLRGMDTVAVDLETLGLNPATLRVRIVSVTTQKGSWLVDCFAVDPSPLLPALTGKTLLFHNALFDLTVLAIMGLDLGRVREVIDTMVMSRLVEVETTETKEET